MMVKDTPNREELTTAIDVLTWLLTCCDDGKGYGYDYIYCVRYWLESERDVHLKDYLIKE